MNSIIIIIIIIIIIHVFIKRWSLSSFRPNDKFASIVEWIDSFLRLEFQILHLEILNLNFV